MKRWWRNTYWFISGFLKKYKKQLMTSFLLAIVLVVIVLQVLPRLPKSKPERLVGVIGRYSLSQLPKDVEDVLGPGLTVLDEKLRPAAGVAERWVIEDDGKVYRFYLKEGQKWSDGEEIRAEELEFSVPNVEISQQNGVIEFKLPDAFAPFATLLHKPLVKGGVVTAGEYNIEEVSVDGPHLTKLVLNGDDDKLIYEFYPTLNQAVVAFKLGKIDELVDMLNETELKDWPNTKVEEEIRFDKYVGLFYNMKDPVVGGTDQKFRQALSYAIKDKAFGGKRALGPIDPRSWAYNPTIKPYDYDLARAKSLAGDKLGEGMEIELVTTPELLDVADKVKADWKELGVETKIRVVSILPDDYQVYLGVQQTDADPDQYVMWHSTQEATNFTHLNDEKIDQLLEDGRRTVDMEERRQIYFDVQRFILEEAPATFLYHPVTYRIKRD